MKKKSIALVLLMVMMFTVSAEAVELRAISAKPRLSFSGQTAYCSATITSNPTDSISATLTLYQGSNYVDSWTDSGQGRLILSGQTSVRSGRSYTLKVSYTINGTAQAPSSTTSTCP